MCGLSSCGWQEAKEVIITADSLDQTEHVIYDDTAALGRTIRSLDNPFGRKSTENGKLKGDYGFATWIFRYTSNKSTKYFIYVRNHKLEPYSPIP